MDPAPWFDLNLTSPWMNAAGFCGYLPPAKNPLPETAGAFVTNPVSLLPRKPAQNRAVVTFAGGFMLHTGHPNPGIHSVLRNYAQRWKNMPQPVWVHLIPASAYEMSQMIEILEEVENVAAVEVGLPPELPGRHVLDFLSSGAGELPLLVGVNVEDASAPWVNQLVNSGVAGIVLTGPRGMLPNHGRNLRGRIYGPCVLPLMMKAVAHLAHQDLPIIASGGIYDRNAADSLLDAGANAIQLDGVLWRGWED